MKDIRFNKRGKVSFLTFKNLLLSLFYGQNNDDMLKWVSERSSFLFYGSEFRMVKAERRN
ncbi:hypothetical protein MX023_08540 [Streptococcus uberis]|nr:hypothetical protein [Streptococcus uberis]